MTVRNGAPKLICIIVAAVLAMLAFGLTNRTALAEQSLDDSPSGMYMTYPSPETGKPTAVGVIALDKNGNYYYCSEIGENVDYVISDTTIVDDSDAARRVAWLMDRYSTTVGTGRLVFASIGMFVHDYFDVNQERWQAHRAEMVKKYPHIEERMERLWEEAGRNTVSSAVVEQTYAKGIREGDVIARIVNGYDEPVAGISYTITLNGPAVFVDNGEATISGVTGDGPITHAWRATAVGEVSVTPTYDVPALEYMPGAQDLISLSDETTTRGGDVVRFAVRRDFEPTIVTTTAQGAVEAGDYVHDDVTVLLDGERGQWLDGEAVNATGWYFDGIPAARVDDDLAPDAGERAEAFVKRIGESGYAPAGYGTATFTGSGQTVRVRAMTEFGGDEPYRAAGDGLFGTWVWAIERDEQSDAMREYLEHDIVTPFLDPAETNVNRPEIAVESTVAESRATVGDELSDTITIGGFPDDHGSFTGDAALGLGADRTHAQVSVWWAGDADDPSKDDDWRPSGTQVPTEDEHHRLIGTWDYPAVNGRIVVGGGQPDAHGDPVHIVAETHGWYVFVWSFAGDDRVPAASSAYDDAWERTRVTPPEEPETPPETPPDEPGEETPPPDEETPPDEPEDDELVLNTQVDPEHATVGESFRDVATIRGALPDGAYVTFSAWEAIGDGELPGLNGKLLDEAKVEPIAVCADGATADGADDAVGEAAGDAADGSVTGDEATGENGLDSSDSFGLVDCDRSTVWSATSPAVSSSAAGLVHWRATVFSKDGDVLVTHALGVEGEVVTVTEEPEEPVETVEETPEEPLPFTGSDFGVVLSVACIALLAGLSLLAAAHRHPA
ncbi:peptidase [Bifidobacterium sp. 82T10]|uniref:Peptidase n=1 Tax=Bifidobacterium miconis TaxID=2834435 RepID=A0ABS6WEH9_9BIFI|nr:peptidase [Bifidobacterium miconis]MBW3092443.1 peptidase [Bifidobacterium miconis]